VPALANAGTNANSGSSDTVCVDILRTAAVVAIIAILDPLMTIAALMVVALDYNRQCVNWEPPTCLVVFLSL